MLTSIESFFLHKPSKSVQNALEYPKTLHPVPTLMNILLCHGNSIDIFRHLNNPVDVFLTKIIPTIYIETWLSERKY